MKNLHGSLFGTTRLIWTFYRSFIFLSTLITVCCIVLFREYGVSIFIALFWLKISSLTIIYYFINYYKRNEYYYYFNLGLSKKWLGSPRGRVDCALFISTLSLAHHFK